MDATAAAATAAEPIQAFTDLGASIEKSDKYIPQERKLEFKLEVESKLNGLMEDLLWGVEQFVAPDENKKFREFFKIQFTRALEKCIKSLFNDVLSKSDGDLKDVKDIWEGLNLKIEKMSRRLELNSPTNPEAFKQALWWLAEQGTEEDLRLVREISKNPPYGGDDIANLLCTVEGKLAEKVDDPEHVVRRGEEAYQHNKDEWDGLYQGKYIAIHRGEVMFADADESSLIRRVIQEQKRQRRAFRVYIVEVGAPVLSLRPPGPKPRAEAGPETVGAEEARRKPADLQRLGWDAFRERLPRLLETDAGRWVAFHGQTLLALADTKREVYEHLTPAGVPLKEVIVCHVGPLPPPIDLRRHRGLKVR